MEYPDSYPYPTTASNLNELKSMGHTTAPGVNTYRTYAPSSSDNLVSRDLHRTWSQKPAKQMNYGLSTTRTPFMEAPGIKARPLAGFTGYTKGGNRNNVTRLPPVQQTIYHGTQGQQKTGEIVAERGYIS